MCWLLLANYRSAEDGGGPRSTKRQADTLLVAPQLDLHMPAPLIHLAAATQLLLPSLQLHIMEDVASAEPCDSVRASTETLNAPSRKELVFHFALRQREDDQLKKNIYIKWNPKGGRKRRRGALPQ